MAIAGVGCQFMKLYVTGSVPSHVENQDPADAGGGTWGDVAEVMSVDGPSPERDTYDTTVINTKGNYRTFIPGLKDGGEISLEMNYTKESYQEFKTDFDRENENALLWYSVVFNDASSQDAKSCIVFQGMVTNVGASIPTDDKVSSNCSIKVSGDPVYTTVSTRNSGTIGVGTDARTISPSGVPPLVWRGFLNSVTINHGASHILPSAFGGKGAITYEVRHDETNLSGVSAGANNLSFDASTRTLTVGSTFETDGDLLALVYTATDSTTPTAQLIRQGIILTIGSG